tara:strand:- start:762 stop:1697 length:936 start_codon:yes stop_codon:yes gene_type:complete
MRKIALVFPGQGSQYLGMFKDLDTIEDKRLLDIFNIASNIFNQDFLQISSNGSNEKLSSTYIAQPIIFLHSILIDRILKLNNLNVCAVAGHSLGEYTALVSSGVISFEDCLKILKVRCTEMEKVNKKYQGSMLAILNDDIRLIENICKNLKDTVIANVNSQNQIIISGPIEQIEKSVELLKENNIKKIVKLNVSGAFHSPLMREANVSLNKVINSVNFNDSNFALYQNVYPNEIFDGKKIKENLKSQLCGRVNWLQIIKNMKTNNIDTIFEIGPKNVLSKLIKKIEPSIEVKSLDKIGDLVDSGFNIGIKK